MKHENFKTCDQSGFCKRNRAYADKASSAGSSWISPYSLDTRTIEVKNGQLTGIVSKKLEHGAGIARLPLTITFLQSGLARVTVDEERRQKADIELRHGSQARKERYNEVTKWAIVGELNPAKDIKSSTQEGTTIVPYGPENKFKAIVKHQPFSIDFLRDDEVHIRFNDKGLLNLEHWRQKIEREVKEGEEAPPEPSEDESTWWEESFGGNTDSKPKGPESVGLDISFPGYGHVYGIASHSGPLSLKETRCVQCKILDTTD